MSYSAVVVNLSVVAEPQVRKPLDTQRLHPIQLVHDGQAVETKAAVGKAVHILKAKSVRPSVSYLHGTRALN